MKRLPILAQVLGLVVATLLAAQAVSFALVASRPPPEFAIYRVTEIAAAMRGGSLALGSRGTLIRTVGAAAAPEAAPPAEPRWVRWLKESVRLDRAPPEPRRQLSRDAGLSQALAAALGADAVRVSVSVEQVGPDGGQMMHRLMYDGLRLADGNRIVVGSFRAARTLPDGRIESVSAQRDGGPGGSWRGQLALLILGTIALLLPIAWLLARALTRPIRAFADAADRIGRDPGAPPVAIGGPPEIVAAGEALNAMQARLRAFVGERMRIVAAVAHDLRTPLHRLAFRIEAAPPEVRAKAAADIAEMGAMIDATLSFVRDATVEAPRVPLDLRSLLETVVDGMVDTGAVVTLDPGDAPVIVGDTSGLKRLFANLIGNAVNYAGSGRVRLSVAAGEALCEIDDDGPGLTPEDMARAFEPFYRAESSRSRETGGSGLGLAVARDIARAHGGDVTLANRPGGGLRASVRLPL